MSYVQTSTESCHNVIYEDEEDKISNNESPLIFDTEDEDSTSAVKKGNILMRHLVNKLNKNIAFIFSMITLILFYYFIVFESIMPIYESQMIMNTLKQNNKNKQIGSDSFSQIFFNNKGVSYFIIFHFLFFFYTLGYMKVSLYDPGSYDKDYVKLYSLKKYAAMYSNFVYRVLFEPKKNNMDLKISKVMEDIKYPILQFKSKDLLKKQEKTN